MSNRTHHRSTTVRGHEIAYREAGPADAPVLLLLHGFPTSSHMFRDLIPLLADRYRVIAPDHIGFGRSATPPHRTSRTPSPNSPTSPRSSPTSWA